MKHVVRLLPLIATIYYWLGYALCTKKYVNKSNRLLNIGSGKKDKKAIIH